MGGTKNSGTVQKIEVDNMILRNHGELRDGAWNDEKLQEKCFKLMKSRCFGSKDILYCEKSSCEEKLAGLGCVLGNRRGQNWKEK